jgi:myo-inositol-1(or 4)-monophosphatase
VLSPAELDDCEQLVERIVSERPRADQISTKTSDADWVTETDLAVERHVRETVQARFPGHRIVGEEYGETDGASATWYVDPVDGTTNFVHGLPWSSFSIAVVDDEGPAVGAVADPYRREVLSAVRGRGARRNREPSRCAGSESLVGGIFMTELTMQSLWPGQSTLMASLAKRGCVTRIMGSNALSLASVGAGRASATLIGKFGPIDCHAGTLIARESGARVIFEREGVLCAVPGVADELLGLWEAAENGR